LLLVPALDSDTLARALLAGAGNCISCRVDSRELIEAVRATARGETIFPESLGNGLSRAMLQIRADGLERLSPRELEVLRLAARGLSVSEIASQLCVSLNTARTHLRRTYRKLGAHNRSEAVDKAMRAGILRHG
jgi:DNA-binding NarL/FixJ family response regulator